MIKASDPPAMYTVTWKDKEGAGHSQTFETTSASAAIALAIEKIALLQSNPHLITRVLKES